MPPSFSYAQANPKPTPVLALDIQELVPPTQKPDERPMLEALHAAQATLAAQEAKKVAEEAQLAQEAARVAYVAPVATFDQPAQVGPLGNLYTPGQCTAYVASRVAVPSTMGNATNWEAGLLNAGWHYGLRAGSIGVSHVGVNGHVVYVESVVGPLITISEMNALYGPFGVDTRIALASEFIWLAT